MQVHAGYLKLAEAEVQDRLDELMMLLPDMAPYVYFMDPYKVAR